MGGITLENVEKKLLGKIDRKKGGLQYARSLFSGVDPVTTPNGYADFDEPTQSKIRNTVIIVAVYGDSSSFKGLASDMQSPSESRAITLGLCHFLRKTAPTITMLELSFKDDQGDFKIEECLDGSLRGINQISFFMKQAAKGFSARFCHLNTKSREAGSAVPRPTDLITVFNDAAMLALPTSGPCPESDLTLRRVASLTATSPGHNDIKSSLLANQYGAGGSESRIFSHVDANGSDEENGDKKNKEPTCPCIIM
jgi:hypothetical protein